MRSWGLRPDGWCVGRAENQRADAPFLYGLLFAGDGRLRNIAAAAVHLLTHGRRGLGRWKDRVAGGSWERTLIHITPDDGRVLRALHSQTSTAKDLGAGPTHNSWLGNIAAAAGVWVVGGSRTCWEGGCKGGTACEDVGCKSEEVHDVGFK